MGSSSGGDYAEPPKGPGPPPSMIAGLGQSTPLQPHFINFLGDTNVPSRGLTPDMLSAIDAMNGPATPPPMTGGGNYDSQITDLRNQLAAMQAAQSKPKPQMMGRGGGEGGASHSGAGSGGNSGGWGGH